MAMPNVLRGIIGATAAWASMACSSPSEPGSGSLSLVSVDGHALPYQVGVTNAGRPLIIYSGYALNVPAGHCIFVVDVDRGDALSFTGEYHANGAPGCTLIKGVATPFTYAYPFREVTSNPARTYVFQ